MICNLAEAVGAVASVGRDTCAVSFDFVAAFDSVDHAYHTDVFNYFGFPPYMINMLKMLTKERNAKIVDGYGKLSRPFTIERGVPLGGLHSPLTFVISVAPLLAKL